jgi:hypothetical protein
MSSRNQKIKRAHLRICSDELRFSTWPRTEMSLILLLFNLVCRPKNECQEKVSLKQSEQKCLQGVGHAQCLGDAGNVVKTNGAQPVYDLNLESLFTPLKKSLPT